WRKCHAAAIMARAPSGTRLRSTAGLEQKQGTPLGLVDPDLEQTGGRHISPHRRGRASRTSEPRVVCCRPNSNWKRGRAAAIIVFDHSCSYAPLIAST